jgi:hypothetical protein
MTHAKEILAVVHDTGLIDVAFDVVCHHAIAIDVGTNNTNVMHHATVIAVITVHVVTMTSVNIATIHAELDSSFTVVAAIHVITAMLTLTKVNNDGATTIVSHVIAAAVIGVVSCCSRGPTGQKLPNSVTVVVTLAVALVVALVVDIAEQSARPTLHTIALAVVAMVDVISIRITHVVVAVHVHAMLIIIVAVIGLALTIPVVTTTLTRRAVQHACHALSAARVTCR